jgi:hypothetical protein
MQMIAESRKFDGLDERYLKATRLVDFTSPAIAQLVRSRGWEALTKYYRIAKIYDFVQNEIEFGFSEADDLPASRVLEDGLGQCNTKATLLMALLRACGIPCRFHAFTIDKKLQRGALAGLSYRIAQRNIIHSWVEVWFGGRWVNLEGFVLDRAYLESVQQRFASVDGPFYGYGIATDNLQHPPIAWTGTDTYIQKDGINADFGAFDAPDDFYATRGTGTQGLRAFLFRHLLMKRMNGTVSKIRAAEWS